MPLGDVFRRWMAFGLFVGLAVVATQATATTYYIGPSGSDGASGRSAGSPFKTFRHAVAKLGPGDTLVLKDGAYTRRRTGLPYINCDGWANNGTSSAPITLEAQHERRAHLINSGDRSAFFMIGCRNWNINGLFVEGKDQPGGARRTFGVKDSHHIKIKRLLGYKNNRYTNSAVVEILQSKNVLIEEAEIYKFHRNGISTFQSEFVTIRRSYMNSRGYHDLDGGRPSHGNSTDGGDAAATFYYASNSIIENCLSEHKSEGFGLGSSGLRTGFGNTAGRDNKLLGSISLDDNKGGGLGESRKKPGYALRAGGHGYVENYLVVNPVKKGLTARSLKGVRGRNITVYKDGNYGQWGGAFVVNGDHQDFAHNWRPSCAEIDGCSYHFKNMLISVAQRPGYFLTDGVRGFNVSYSNVFGADFATGSENIADGAGAIRHSTATDPNMGVGAGQCIAFVPEDSPMKGAGENGADMGANVLYRYVNGRKTDVPLWKGGKYPCGAIVKGINDKAGDSCFDVHKRLNIGANGCSLPDGYLDAKPSARPPRRKRPKVGGGCNAEWWDGNGDGQTGNCTFGPLVSNPLGGVRIKHNYAPHAKYPYEFKVVGQDSKAWWRFKVNGRLGAEKFEDDDSIDGGRSRGWVTDHADIVHYAGELTFMDVEAGTAKVYVRDTLVAGGNPQSDHRLVIEGYSDTSQAYHARVGGGLEGHSLESGTDRLYYNFAYGRVSSGKDVFTFHGDLDRLEVRGDVRVLLDGKLLRGKPRADGGPMNYDGRFKITGADGSDSLWYFEVNGQPHGKDLEGADRIYGGQTSGVVDQIGESDVIDYDGRMTLMNVRDSTAEARLNGVLVAGGPQQKAHELAIDADGSSEPTDYFVEVNAGLAGGSLESDDIVNGKQADGQVDGDKDTLTFTGDIDQIELDGPARVYLDGQLIRGGGPANPRQSGLSRDGAPDESASDTAAACDVSGSSGAGPGRGMLAASLVLLLVTGGWRRRREVLPVNPGQ